MKEYLCDIFVYASKDLSIEKNVAFMDNVKVLLLDTWYNDKLVKNYVSPIVNKIRAK